MFTAVYNIVKIGDPVLREVAKEVPEVTPNIIKLLNNMADTMHSAKGVGLAAPQIGISKRVVVIDVGDGVIDLINPKIVHQEGEEIDFEACLSIPGKQEEVLRAAKVIVEALDRNSQKIRVTGSGFLARAFQHEIDHLNGVLFVDKALPKSKGKGK